MQLIKLDAIDSTNDFLKALARSKPLENYTTVLAHRQTNGKGQRGARWLSEPGSNLIMSVLIQNDLVPTAAVFHLNVAVAISLSETYCFGSYPPNTSFCFKRVFSLVFTS